MRRSLVECMEDEHIRLLLSAIAKSQRHILLSPDLTNRSPHDLFLHSFAEVEASAHECAIAPNLQGHLQGYLAHDSD
jgi:hypothetical protein